MWQMKKLTSRLEGDVTNEMRLQIRITDYCILHHTATYCYIHITVIELLLKTMSAQRLQIWCPESGLMPSGKNGKKHGGLRDRPFWTCLRGCLESQEFQQLDVNSMLKNSEIKD